MQAGNGQKPEYILQPQCISRAMYNLSTNARRLIGMAMALADHEAYTVSFSPGAYKAALGLRWGGVNRELTRRAYLECTHSAVHIPLDGAGYQLIPWLDESAADLVYTNGHTIRMPLHPRLAELLIRDRHATTTIRLSDLGKLQSRYAIRYFEWAMSYHNGTQWYFDAYIENILALFCIEPHTYPSTRDFRLYIVDKPIAELNARGIGIQIMPEKIRHGRELAGWRFHCLKKGDTFFSGSS